MTAVLQAMSIQYHPEASPGPHDSDICFDQFIAMLEAERSGGKVPLLRHSKTCLGDTWCTS